MDVVNPSEPEVAFPTARHAPPWDTIPREFQRGEHPACDFIMSFFFRVLPWSALRLLPKPGVTAAHAFRMIQETIGAYNIPHEHKEAACGYMLAEFFTSWWIDSDSSDNDRAYRGVK